MEEWCILQCLLGRMVYTAMSSWKNGVYSNVFLEECCILQCLLGRMLYTAMSSWKNGVYCSKLCVIHIFYKVVSLISLIFVLSQYARLANADTNKQTNKLGQYNRTQQNYVYIYIYTGLSLSRTPLYLEHFLCPLDISIDSSSLIFSLYLGTSISRTSLYPRTKILVPCKFFSPYLELFSLPTACKGRFPFSALS